MRTGENEEECSDDNSYNEYVNMEAVHFAIFFITTAFCNAAGVNSPSFRRHLTDWSSKRGFRI